MWWNNLEKYDYVRLKEEEQWVVVMHPDALLAARQSVTAQQLREMPLVLPQRPNMQNELANWFGEDFQKLNIAYTSNLGTNAGILAVHGLGYPVSIEGAARYWRNDLLVQKKLYPEIKAGTIIAWRRNIPYSVAVKRLIQNIKAFEA